MASKIDEYKAQLAQMASDAAADAAAQAAARLAAKLQVDQADYQLSVDAIVQQFTQEMIDKLNALQAPVDPSLPGAP